VAPAVIAGGSDLRARISRPATTLDDVLARVDLVDAPAGAAR